jgi:hypothetical protein
MLLAEQMLDAAALRELLSENGRARAKRAAVARLEASGPVDHGRGSENAPLLTLPHWHGGP